jgi:hypothetical protein
MRSDRGLTDEIDSGGTAASRRYRASTCPGGADTAFSRKGFEVEAARFRENPLTEMSTHQIWVHEMNLSIFALPRSTSSSAAGDDGPGNRSRRGETSAFRGTIVASAKSLSRNGHRRRRGARRGPGSSISRTPDPSGRLQAQRVTTRSKWRRRLPGRGMACRGRGKR